jgi:hypothetical protein
MRSLIDPCFTTRVQYVMRSYNELVSVCRTLIEGIDDKDEISRFFVFNNRT